MELHPDFILFRLPGTYLARPDVQTWLRTTLHPELKALRVAHPENELGILNPSVLGSAHEAVLQKVLAQLLAQRQQALVLQEQLQQMHTLLVEPSGWQEQQQHLMSMLGTLTSKVATLTERLERQQEIPLPQAGLQLPFAGFGNAPCSGLGALSTFMLGDQQGDAPLWSSSPSTSVPSASSTLPPCGLTARSSTAQEPTLEPHDESSTASSPPVDPVDPAAPFVAAEHASLEPLSGETDRRPRYGNCPNPGKEGSARSAMQKYTVRPDGQPSIRDLESGKGFGRPHRKNCAKHVALAYRRYCDIMTFIEGLNPSDVGGAVSALDKAVLSGELTNTKGKVINTWQQFVSAVVNKIHPLDPTAYGIDSTAFLAASDSAATNADNDAEQLQRLKASKYRRLNDGGRSSSTPLDTHDNAIAVDNAVDTPVHDTAMPSDSYLQETPTGASAGEMAGARSLPTFSPSFGGH